MAAVRGDAPRKGRQNTTAPMPHKPPACLSPAPDGIAMPSPRPAERPPPSASLIVVGASARAWSASAFRAGWRIHAVDLFADRDLAAIALTTTRLGVDYPRSIPAALAPLPIAPVTYTGGLENHPGILAAIARDRLLAGVGPAALRHVRGPIALARLARLAGMLFPETLPSPHGLPRDGSYLVKPLASAGGGGIAPWTGAEERARTRRRRLWQRRIAGRAYSACYVVADAGPRLVGVARQHLGGTRHGGAPFAWCGGASLPVHRLPARVGASLERLGGALWRIGALRGAIGVDFLVTPPGAPVLIEINPRPTASLELHERQRGESIAAAHLDCYGMPRPSAPQGPPARPGCWAKVLVRRPHPVDVDARMLSRLVDLDSAWTAADGGWPALADVPPEGDSLPADGPIITVFAHGATVSAAERVLAARAARVRAVLDTAPAAGPVRRPFARGAPARPTARRTASGTRPRWCPGRSP